MGRGGGGGDSSWHKSGSGLHKKNSVYDFGSCAKYLVDEGYVHKDRLGAIGYSAGCLVVGATINMYPTLFCAAILKVRHLSEIFYHAFVSVLIQQGELLYVSFTL